MRKTVCLAVLVLLAGCKKPDANGMYADGSLASGHSELHGTVKDDSSRNLLPDVTISVADKQVKTDEKGVLLVFLPAGTYSVSYEKDGYERVTNNTYLPSGSVQEVSINLKKIPTPEELKAQAERAAKRQKLVEGIRILHSLNSSDAVDRCGRDKYPKPPGLATLLTYFPQQVSLELGVGDVTLFFVSHYTGPADMYEHAEFTPDGSNHSHPISDEEAIGLMPCLLKGGVAK
jgi:hypothetical protein